MTVIRINEFRAIEGRQDELYSALAGLLPTIRTSEGCLSVQLLESDTDPERLVVIESWRDRESHQTAASAIPPASLHRVMALLAELPTGGYYAERPCQGSPKLP